MNLSKKFTRKEKVLLVVLALLLLAAIYMYGVYMPVRNALADNESQKEELALQLDVLAARQARMDAMRGELDAVMNESDPAQVPDYDNLQQLMVFLNGVLGNTADYSLSFRTIERSEEDVVIRRTVDMSFQCANYKEARSVVEALRNSPYRCQLDAISFVPAGELEVGSGAGSSLPEGFEGPGNLQPDDDLEIDDSSTQAAPPTVSAAPVTSGGQPVTGGSEPHLMNSAVQVSLTVTFFERLK